MITLTPNRRLSAFLVQQYDNLQAKQGLQSWLSAEIYPLEIWLMQIWDLCLDHNFAFYKPLLSIKQQQLLFEQIVQADQASTHLLRINATAQNALQAWGFIAQWRISLDKLAAYAEYHADSAALHKWLAHYLAWLAEHGYVDFNLMVTSIIDNIDVIATILPQKICLRGFNELTPQYAKLFALLRERGLQISTENLSVTNAKVTKIGVHDTDAELNSAVQWIATQLADDPNQTFGVVIPDLAQRRDRVHNYFSAQFPKHWLNISAPKSLLSYSLINTALLILKLANYVVDYNDFSALLRSPFIANFSGGAASRAILDRYLRKNLEAQFTFDHLLAFLPPEQELREYILKFSELVKTLQGKHTTYYWVNKIQELLLAWGWPGERLGFSQNAFIQALSKDDADLLSCWQDLLAEYTSLENILPKHTFAEAMQYLRRFALETPFAPAETGLTKIHVLGLLEAEGLVFDHLWICGMSRDQWPPAANPNPFIPLELQREYDLPHSSAQRELAMAKKYTNTLQLGGRHNVTFCYPEVIDDNHVAPSNLIAHLPVLTLPDFAQKKTLLPLQLEQWFDPFTTPPVSAYASGGTRVLQLQAQCPFKANAEIRLKALELEEPSTILTPDKRGSLVHAVLETFWRTCTSHAQLVAYEVQELQTTLTQVIQTVLQQWQVRLPQTLTNNYIMLEAHRLYNLIANWLEYEKARPAFIVHQVEQKTLITIGPLQINMQIDRIDQIDGQLAIIDYKTGVTQLYTWSKDNVYEPQLQIYATAAGPNVSAVAFAALVPSWIKFKGIAADYDLLPNVIVDHDWPQLLTQWSQQLEDVARDFMSGNALVDPFDPKVCRNCKLQAFCRIYEQ